VTGGELGEDPPDHRCGHGVEVEPVEALPPNTPMTRIERDLSTSKELGDDHPAPANRVPSQNGN
jgi:hypothetical protein